MFHTTRKTNPMHLSYQFWDQKNPMCRLVAIRTLRSNSRRWGEVHIRQCRGPRLVTRNHTPMDTWTGRGQGPLNQCRYCQPRRGFLFSSEFLGFSSQKMDVESPILPNPQMEVEFRMKTSLFFGHEDTQIIHFHMGRHEASRQKKMRKFQQICEWSLPRLERVSYIKTPLVSSRTFRSNSNPSSTPRCHLLARVEDTLQNSGNVTWATKKTLPHPCILIILTVFIGCFFLRWSYNAGSIAPCLFIDQPKLSCELVTLKGGHAGKKCYRKWLLAIDMKPGKWGEMLSERKRWTFLPVLLRKLTKKLPLQIENYLYTYRYWNVYFDVIWVVVIHFVFVLTLGVIPFKVTVAIRKNHCKFDPISWICQKTIPGMLDLWGGRIVRKRWGSCWKSGVWVARTFVIFWGSGKKTEVFEL